MFQWQDGGPPLLPNMGSLGFILSFTSQRISTELFEMHSLFSSFILLLRTNRLWRKKKKKKAGHYMIACQETEIPVHAFDKVLWEKKSS